jgi:ABC-2 type transport system ATP-binding protein
MPAGPVHRAQHLHAGTRAQARRNRQPRLTYRRAHGGIFGWRGVAACLVPAGRLTRPLAALDPLARRNFLAALAEAAAGGGLTIVLSSHLLADIERVCDHLILLAASRVQLCGDTETLLAQHRVLTGPRTDTTAIARTHAIVREDTTPRQTTLLVRLNGPVIDPAWAVEQPNLEEIVLGYMSQDDEGDGTGSGAARLSAVGGER